MRRFLLYGGFAAILGALYVAGVMLYRRTADRDYSRREEGMRGPVPDIVAKQGGAVRILQFYAVERRIPRGGSTNLCYGVQNARAVRLSPPVEELTPSLTRCFTVAPERTSTYRLTAVGKDGREVWAELTLEVGALKPRPY
jgi:hypothetical protein